MSHSMKLLTRCSPPVLQTKAHGARVHAHDQPGLGWASQSCVERRAEHKVARGQESTPDQQVWWLATSGHVARQHRGKLCFRYTFGGNAALGSGGHAAVHTSKHVRTPTVAQCHRQLQTCVPRCLLLSSAAKIPLRVKEPSRPSSRGLQAKQRQLAVALAAARNQLTMLTTHLPVLVKTTTERNRTGG